MAVKWVAFIINESTDVIFNFVCNKFNFSSSLRYDIKLLQQIHNPIKYSIPWTSENEINKGQADRRYNEEPATITMS